MREGAGPQTIRALLGPTNTGKTHAAVERMLQHDSGVIGLPLRLLAREVYDRLTARVGEASVALVTGEEKRVPPRPRFWVCTVEAMPPRPLTDFLVVDEIQLGAQGERGHVFTDRLLGWRGRKETWFLGAETVRPLVERLVPAAEVSRRPRLSTLRGAGSLSLGALPPRTAVVAFSSPRVYELAERLRTRRGGAAVVMGALSPRARNAQVALYQSGEVDYLVATDAIGMGLNLDVDVVAFADTRKFDGTQVRPLTDAELAQIAGRAGRHQNDGRFATLEPLAPLPPSTVRAIERHQFAAEQRLWWRSSDLDMSSLAALAHSLRRPAPLECLRLRADADDERALAWLARRPEITALVRGPEQVSLLWSVCQIPDFRQLALDDHFHLLAALFVRLGVGRGRLGSDWIRRHVHPLADPSGPIDVLLARMATIRTWTYITHHAAWVDDAAGWQEETRAIEDRLSDAVHDALVRRFVGDAARRRPRRPATGPLAGPLAQVLPRLAKTPGSPSIEPLLEAGHDRFTPDEAGGIVAAGWGRVGRLTQGSDLLHPDVIVDLDPDPGPGARLRLHRRLLAWARDLAADLLAPLRAPATASLSAAARGLLYQLERGLGTVSSADARSQVAALTGPDRRTLARIGIRLGRHTVFSTALLEPRALRARAAFCAAALRPGTRLFAPLSAPSWSTDAQVPDAIYTALGFPRVGSRAVRADVIEEVAADLRRGASPAQVAARLGCDLAQAGSFRRALNAAPSSGRRASELRPHRVRQQRRSGHGH